MIHRRNLFAAAAVAVAGWLCGRKPAERISFAAGGPPAFHAVLEGGVLKTRTCCKDSAQRNVLLYCLHASTDLIKGADFDKRPGETFLTLAEYDRLEGPGPCSLRDIFYPAEGGMRCRSPKA